MHTTIDYHHLSGKAKQQAALLDLRNYYGSDKFDHLNGEFKTLKDQGLTFEGFTAYVELSGVQGYPIRAWWDSL